MSIRSKILAEAIKYLGVRYKGINQGTGPEDGGFTCSGFTWRAYNDAGIEIPIAQGIHSYYTDSYNGWDTQCGWTINNGHWTTNQEALQPGDLVFYSPVWDRTRTGHVAIYYGNGKVIHANGSPVAITPLSYGGNFVGGGWPLRELPNDDPTPMIIEEIPMKGSFTFNKYTIVRSEPRISGDTVVSGAHYTVGDTVNLDKIVVSDGYAWGHYIGSSSKKDRYVALGDLDRGTLS